MNGENAGLAWPIGYFLIHWVAGLTRGCRFATRPHPAARRLLSGVILAKFRGTNCWGGRKELDAPVTSIDGQRPLYRAVSRQLNEVLNDRLSQYVLEAKGGPTFREWEQRKQSGETPHKQGPGQ
jgi:hypothetical protein